MSIIPRDEPYFYVEKLQKMDCKIVNQMVMVAGHIEERKMKAMEVLFCGQKFSAYADCITGSIYDAETGRCFSSNSLEIVKRRKRGN
jgi:hypothetical protein